MKRQTIFKRATVHSPKNGPWYIEWYNVHPINNRLTRIRKTFDLNREPLPERKAQAEYLLNSINFALQNGWNFFEEHAEQFQKVKTLDNALKESLKITLMNLGTHAQRSYTSILKVFTQWAEENRLLHIRPSEFKPRHAVAYVATRTHCSPSNINAHILLIRQLFERMRTILNVIATNPWESVTLVKVPETNRYEPLTPEELKQISDYLKAEGQTGYLLYMQFILYAFVRPGHIASIRRSQIDFEAGTIRIFGNETKGKRNITKQLLAPLKEALIRAGVDQVPPEWYVMGHGFKPAEDKCSTLVNIAQKRWVVMARKLGINKHLYALKHTGAQLYIQNNKHVDVAWLQNQMEHAALAETEAYIRKRKAKMIDEESLILPDF